jgi:glycosyltransferase involved in cell wall biosynthesis
MADKGPLVSIIIPFYNSELYLQETINSALGQTWLNKEIILVNDGSTDDSLKIASKFSSRILQLYNQTNLGASAARNLALNYSHGEYIQFLDSDDILAPDKIENQLIQLVKEQTGAIASGPFKNFYESPEKSQPILRDFGYKNFNNPFDWLVNSAFDKAMFPPIVWLTPRSIIEQAGYWNEMLSYNDDTEFFARIILKAKSILFCEGALSYYRRGNPHSLGSQKSYKARKSEFDSLSLLTDYMLQHEDSDVVREACIYQFSKLYYSLYPEFKFLRKELTRKSDSHGMTLNFEFGKGITSQIGKIIGWRTSKWLKYYLMRTLRIWKSLFIEK